MLILAPSYRKRMADSLLGSMRRTLVSQNKIATRATYNSLEVVNFATSTHGYAGKGWLHIQWGKRANTKLPVRKSGDKWELLPPLAAWKAVKAPNIPDFVLARSIAKKARKPIPIGDMALADSGPRTGPIALQGYSDLIGRVLANSIKIFLCWCWL